MTVIFHTNSGLPVLAGDMLLSVADSTAKSDLKLPSHPKGIVIPLGVVPDHIPVKMRRKIFLVNDHLAIGVAGPVTHLRMFLHDFTDAFGDKPLFAAGEIKDYLSVYSSTKLGRQIFDQIGFIILVEATDWRGSLARGATPETSFVSKTFGKTIAIGSGSHGIIDQIGKLDCYAYRLSQPPDGDGKFPEFPSLVQNLCLLGNVYWNEIVSPSRIFEAWGGAYDLIYQDKTGKFLYLDDYTIVLRLFDVDRAERGIQLMNVLKYERNSEVSYVAMLTDNGLNFLGGTDLTSSRARTTITLNRDEFTMNSKYHISIIAVGKGNRFGQPLVQVDGADPDELTKQTVFTWFDDEGRLSVAFHADHDKWLEEQAMSFYSKHQDSWG